MKNEKNISDGKTAKRFKTISLIWLGLFVISVVFYFVEINIFSFLTLFSGIGLYIWFLLDDKMLQSDKYYSYCFLITIAFGGYCLLLKTENDIKFSALFPLCLLVVQKPIRLICKFLSKREPVFKGSTWGDIAYTLILLLTFVLPIIIVNLLK